MTANDALISFKGVQKTYDGTQLVVRDLNLDIQRGEFFVAAGPFGLGQNHHLDDVGGV